MAEIVATFPEAPLLMMAFCPVGTASPDQLPAVFQSVLVAPVQSAALAAEIPMAAMCAVMNRRPRIAL